MSWLKVDATTDEQKAWVLEQIGELWKDRSCNLLELLASAGYGFSGTDTELLAALDQNGGEPDWSRSPFAPEGYRR